jgi:hypothetical protein
VGFLALLIPGTAELMELNMTTSDNTDPTPKSRQKGGRRSGTSPAAPANTAPRRSARIRRSLSEPDCIHDDEALRWSWDAMQESGGWR